MSDTAERAAHLGCLDKRCAECGHDEREHKHSGGYNACTVARCACLSFVRHRDVLPAAPAAASAADVATLERVYNAVRCEPAKHIGGSSEWHAELDMRLACTGTVLRALTEARARQPEPSAPQPAGEVEALLREADSIAPKNLHLDDIRRMMDASEGENRTRAIVGNLATALRTTIAERAVCEDMREAERAGVVKLRAEHAKTVEELRAKLEQAEASRDRLIDVVAQESHAVGISETMTPEERVRAMRARIEQEATPGIPCDDCGGIVVPTCARCGERFMTAAEREQIETEPDGRPCPDPGIPAKWATLIKAVSGVAANVEVRLERLEREAERARGGGR